MILSFRHKGLRRFHERGDSSGINPNLLKRVVIALDDLDRARKPSDLDMPGYRLHQLRGDPRGVWSIWVSGNWRITFRIEAGHVRDVDLVDYH